MHGGQGAGPGQRQSLGPASKADTCLAARMSPLIKSSAMAGGVLIMAADGLQDHLGGLCVAGNTAEVSSLVAPAANPTVCMVAQAAVMAVG